MKGLSLSISPSLSLSLPPSPSLPISLLTISLLSLTTYIHNYLTTYIIMFTHFSYYCLYLLSGHQPFIFLALQLTKPLSPYITNPLPPHCQQCVYILASTTTIYNSISLASCTVCMCMFVYDYLA